MDQALEPFLINDVKKTSGGGMVINLGDKELNYSIDYKLFMCTSLPNPHYSPETNVKVTIINFAITPNGLEEQMLAKVVELENPQLEQKKKDIVEKNAQDKKELLNLEDGIL